jgi:hypothetical protein
MGLIYAEQSGSMREKLVVPSYGMQCPWITPNHDSSLYQSLRHINPLQLRSEDLDSLKPEMPRPHLSEAPIAISKSGSHLIMNRTFIGVCSA